MRMPTPRRLVQGPPPIRIRLEELGSIFGGNLLEDVQQSIGSRQVRSQQSQRLFGRFGRDDLVAFEMKVLFPRAGQRWTHIVWQVGNRGGGTGGSFLGLGERRFVRSFGLFRKFNVRPVGTLGGVPVCMADGFKVKEYVGIVLSLQWVGPSMDHRVTFVHHHVTRFHGHIVGLTIVINDLQRPRLGRRLIVFLRRRRDMKDTRRYQWQSVHVRCKDGALVVSSDPIYRCHNQRLPRPRFQNRLYRVDNRPQLFFTQMLFDIQHFRRYIPMIHIGIRWFPQFHLGFILLLIPKLHQHVLNVDRREDFGISRVRVIIHGRRLLQIHFDTVRFKLLAMLCLCGASSNVLLIDFGLREKG
mmetsp:Transcript_95957/g.143694  ORF Transcript_95957/g.143694 Transcript_95957/m.143694 type:complete len:356 (-) Transcript_95957:78-1145(-)